MAKDKPMRSKTGYISPGVTLRWVAALSCALACVSHAQAQSKDAPVPSQTAQKHSIRRCRWKH